MKLVRVAIGGCAVILALLVMTPAAARDRLVRIEDGGPTAGRFVASSSGSSGATIDQGDRVFWENHDDLTHNATGQGWGTGNIAPGGESSGIPFNTPGTFSYQCTIHPSMTGTLQVNPVSTTAPPPTSPPVTATPMQPPRTTVRPATATTARRTTATTVASSGATTTTGGFELLAPTTTLDTTTTTAQQLAIREDDDDGGVDPGTVAAAVLAPLVLLGGGGFLLYRLRARP